LVVFTALITLVSASDYKGPSYPSPGTRTAAYKAPEYKAPDYKAYPASDYKKPYEHVSE